MHSVLGGPKNLLSKICFQELIRVFVRRRADQAGFDAANARMSVKQASAEITKKLAQRTPCHEESLDAGHATFILANPKMPVKYNIGRIWRVS